MLNNRRLQSTRITKVKGHTDDELVRIGAVEQVDPCGNDQADSAADLGRRHVDACVIDGSFLRHVILGTLLCVVYIGSSSRSLVLSLMMTKVDLLLILRFGLLAVCLRNAKLKGVSETLLGFPGMITSGLGDGKGSQTSVSLSATWLFLALGCWVSC